MPIMDLYDQLLENINDLPQNDFFPQIASYLQKKITKNYQKSTFKFKLYHKNDPKKLFNEQYHSIKNNRPIPKDLQLIRKQSDITHLKPDQKDIKKIYISTQMIIDFLEEFCDFYEIENSVVLVAIFYLFRLENLFGFKIVQENMRPLLTFGLIVAQKQFSDIEEIDIGYVGKLFPLINFTDVEEMEIEFIKLLQFQLYVDFEELDQFYQDEVMYQEFSNKLMHSSSVENQNELNIEEEQDQIPDNFIEEPQFSLSKKGQITNMNSSGGTNELNDSKSTCFSISNSPAGDSLKLLGSM